MEIIAITFTTLAILTICVSLYSIRIASHGKRSIKEFCSDIKIGDKYISNVQLSNLDPFDPIPETIYVEVTDIKRNLHGDVWVEVVWNDGFRCTLSAERLYYDFHKFKE